MPAASTASAPAPPHSTHGGRWRRAGRACLWVLVAGWVAFTLLRLLQVEILWPMVAAFAYTPYVALATLFPLALAAVLRAWRLLAAVSTCLLVLVLLVVPRAVPATAPAADGPPLQVMAVNMYAGGGEPERVLELARDHDVDILVVSELTYGSADGFAGAGIDSLLPYQDLRTGRSVEGTGIYARFPITAAAELEFGSRFAMPAVQVEVPGAAPVALMAVHPAPPVPGIVPIWRRELYVLPPATPDGAVRILAGDFNATLDHAPLRHLIATGYTDAADATGAGLVGTWRKPDGIGALAPPVPLDRVLVDDRVAVEGFTVHHLPGSDHRAVVAELTLPAG